MANDCLVTKLKSVVNNDNLHYLECIKVVKREIPSNEWNALSDVDKRKVNYISMNVTSNVTLKIISGNAYFTDGTFTENRGTTVTYKTGMSGLYISNHDATILIKGKYFVRDLWRADSHTASFGNATLYVEDLTAVNLHNLSNSPNVQAYPLLLDGNISKIEFRYFECFDLIGANIDLSLQKFNNSISLDKLYLSRNHGVSGDIENLSNCTALTNIFLRDTSCSGSINVLLDALYTNGKRGTLSINCTNTSCKFNGSDVSSTLVFTFTDNGWTLNS